MTTAPLHDHQIEREYLGALVQDPGHIDRFPIAPRELHSVRHAAVLEAILALHERKEPIDLLAVRGELERSGTLKRAGGEDGFTDAVVSPTASAEALRVRIRELAMLRDVRDKMLRAVVLLDAHDIEGAIGIVHEVADAARLERQREVIASLALMRTTVDHLGLFQDNAPTRLIPTGLSALDEAIGGLEAGDLLTIGAATNVGKSWIALTSAVGAARLGYGVGIISLEDPKHLWGSRLLTMLSGVSSRDMRRRALGPADYDALARVMNDSRELGVHIAIATGASVHEVIDTMRALVRDHGCRSIVIDYAQCLHGVEASSEHVAAKRMYTMLKGAAERLGVPLILLSQVNRAAADEPSKKDLKEGGDLENKSEYVVMLWRGPSERDGTTSTELRAKLDKSKVGGNGKRFAYRQLPSGALVEHGCEFSDEAPRPSMYERALAKRRGEEQPS